MERTVRSQATEDERLEQDLDGILRQLKEGDARIAQRQARIDALREETRAILAEIRAIG